MMNAKTVSLFAGISLALAGTASADVNQDLAAWINSDPATRVSADGPDLGAYGDSYADVGRCKFDVARVLTQDPRRPKFERKCYDLLPVEHRESLYQMDQRQFMTTPVPTVRIIIVR